ncbi:MAG: nucleoside recognition domain-containing protein [Desulfitobacterium hafniense]|nr:nucleoside recognition domain-containing protein [Desulfitobacterium hafniense]
MGSIRRGFFVGLRTTWDLGKVIFPVTVLVTILKYTPILGFCIKLLTPLMGWIGLPGEAAIPLVLGNFLNIYAGIGAILTLDLTVKDVFILAIMISFSHNLLIESSVAARVGVKMWLVMGIRIGLALLAAVVINFVWHGGEEIAKYGFIPQTNENINGVVQILYKGIESATLGIVQVAIIVIPVMVFIQILKDRNWLQVFSRWMSPATRALGMNENTSLTLVAGLIFGLAYGAGVMMQAVKEDGVSKKDLYLAFIFLVSSHAVIEDTLVFIPLGIPVWPLLVIRVLVAVLLTVIVALIWNKRSLNLAK